MKGAQETVSLLSEALGGLGMGRVGASFGFLAIAEDEIRAVFKAREDEPAGLFNSLVPPDSMIGKDEAVYRAHAKELVARAKRGASRAPGTRAEALISLLAASEKAPLQTLGYAVARRLFVHVYPGKAAEFPEPEEPWKGSIEEEIATICKKLTVKGR